MLWAKNSSSFRSNARKIVRQLVMDCLKDGREHYACEISDSLFNHLPPEILVRYGKHFDEVRNSRSLVAGRLICERTNEYYLVLGAKRLVTEELTGKDKKFVCRRNGTSWLWRLEESEK